MSPELRSFVRFLIFGISLWNMVETANRSKRELKFPKGASLSAGVAVTNLLPKGIADGFVHVLEFDLGFPFPEQFAIDEVDRKKVSSTLWKNPYKSLMTRKNFATKRKPEKKYRSQRNVKDEEKRKLLLKIEDAISILGYNGQACLSRFQCELNQISANGSLLEELLISLFKISSRFTEEECFKFTEYCSVSLLHVLLHSKQMLTVAD